jgi:hypothetical protein
MTEISKNTQVPQCDKTAVSSSLFSKLELSIFYELPYLRNIEIGQRFHSDYYGTITATKITNWGKMVYSIYGFDEKDGSPRDCYYPRDLGLLGKNIMLNDVLKWHSSNGRDKYSHFEISKGEAYFSIYDGEETESLVWDLSKPFLKDQSNELLEWLADLL